MLLVLKGGNDEKRRMWRGVGRLVGGVGRGSGRGRDAVRWWWRRKRCCCVVKVVTKKSKC